MARILRGVGDAGRQNDERVVVVVESKVQLSGEVDRLAVSTPLDRQWL